MGQTQSIKESFESWSLSFYGLFYTPRLLALQGSSTYLLRFLGLEGQVITKSKLANALRDQVQTWHSKLGAGVDDVEVVGIDFTNLVNVVFADVMLSCQATNTDYLLAKREYLDRDSKPLFTSMWSGAVYKLLTTSYDKVGERFRFVDIGSGELKYFSVMNAKSDGTFASEGQDGSADGEKFMDLVSGFCGDTVEVSQIIEFLRQGDDGPIYGVASETMRNLYDEFPEKMGELISGLTAQDIHISILTAAEEAEYESIAVRNAIRMCSDAPSEVSTMELVGNLAWGNGSVQGRNSNKVGLSYAPVGLKTLKTILEDRISKGIYPGVEVVGEGRKQKVFFPDSTTLNSVILGLRTVLLEKLPSNM